MFKNSIILIGEISSGKSTLAKRLSSELQISKASFGGYLVHYCEVNNIPENQRGDLQNLGQSMIESDATGFLKNVIDFSGLKTPNAIFEGVRHHVILKAIQNISKTTQIIYIDATREQRLERFLKREKTIDNSRTESEFVAASLHKVEREVAALREFSSIVIESSNSLEDDFSIMYEFVTANLHNTTSQNPYKTV